MSLTSDPLVTPARDGAAGPPADGALRDQLEKLRLLTTLAQTLNRSTGVGEMYQAAMDGFAAALRAHRMAILLADDDGVTRFKAWRGLSDAYRAAVEGHMFWAPDEADPAPVIVADAAVDPLAASLAALLASEHIAAFAAVPLVVRGRTIGKCMLYFAEPRQLSEDELMLVITVADYVAIAIEREQSAARLQQRESRFSALLQDASDITTILDRAGLIRYQSPAFFRLLGWTEAEVMGRSAFDLIHAEDRERTLAVFADLVTNGGVSPAVEFRFQHADGRYLRLESIGVARLDDPTIAGVVVNSRDITERRRLEDDLRQAHKMEAIGRLAGGVAHDFNNLLTVIVGFAEGALEEADVTPATRKALQEIRLASDRASQLTRGLLAFARRGVVTPTAVDLNATVLGLSEMLQRLIGTDIRLSVGLTPGVGFIRIDPGQLEQIVMNLAINAREAMPEGGALAIDTAVINQGATVTLTVRDTGCGMDATTVSHVFEPFFTTKSQGTGLGLATVYGIVTQHGGTIAVDSSPGRGSVFSIAFPSLPGLASAPDDQTRRPGATTGHETVLVVEDEPLVRELVRKVLERVGYRVLESATGEEAIATFGAAPDVVDLLITDMVMPGVSGRVLAERLRSERPELKALFISGYTEDAVLRAGTLASGTRFLQKPFTPDGLRHAVRDLLDAPGQIS